MTDKRTTINKGKATRANDNKANGKKEHKDIANDKRTNANKKMNDKIANVNKGKAKRASGKTTNDIRVNDQKTIDR